jgi:ABC-type uncharacterized transport system permease subunit
MRQEHEMKLSKVSNELRFNVLVTTMTILVPFIIGAMIMLFISVNPIAAYRSLFYGAFGTLAGFGETMAKASPLLLTGVGVAIAFRCSSWNIGAEGQLLMGAIATTWLGLFFIPLPPIIIISLSLVLSFAAGGLFGFIPGLLKARFNANEIITTMMLNYVAVLIVSYLVSGPWRAKTKVSMSPMTDTIASSLQLPVIIPGTRFHIGILLGIALAVFSYFLLFKSSLGYKIRAVGLNPRAASFGGINVKMVMVLSMVLSGGIAAIGGMAEVAGLHHQLMDGISPGYGYTAIVVALLGRLNPLGIIVSSILFAGLIVGADTMQQQAGVPISIIRIIQALVIIFVLASEGVMRWRKKRA